jgi:O-antigen ligase
MFDRRTGGAQDSGSGRHAAIIVPLIVLGIIVGLCAINPLIALAVALLMIVLMLAFRKPDVWLAIAFGTGILPQSVFGDDASVFVAFSDVMALIMLLVLLPMLALRRIHVTVGPYKVALLSFLGVSFFASLAHWTGTGAIVQLGRMVEFTTVTTMLFMAFIRNPRQMDLCFTLLLILDACLGIAAIVGFAAGARNGLYILGMHKNAIGPSLACGAVVGFVYLRSPDVRISLKKWILCAFVLCLGGAILSLSRGAWMATLGGCLLVLALRRDLKGLLVAAALAVPIFVICWSVLPEDSAKYAGNMTVDSYTVKLRLQRQADMIEMWKQSPIIGNGVGLVKIENPENVYVQSLAETGVVGLASFLLLLGSVYALVIKVSRLLTEGDLWASRSGRMLLCCAGVFTVPTIHAAIDVYWRRGVVFLAWASAGMCISLYLYLRKQANEARGAQDTALKGSD